MRTILAKSLGLVAVLILTVGSFQAQGNAGASTNSDLEKPIQNCIRQVAGWRHAEALEIASLAVTLALGVIIAAVQRKNEGAAQSTTVVLGIIVAILTGVNGLVFPADVKTLRRTASDGDAIINQLWVQKSSVVDAPTPDDKRNATAEYLNTLNQFQALADALAGSSIPPASNSAANEIPGIVPTVYAHSTTTLPSWVTQKPADTATARFFVGKASDATLAVAKQNSADAALYHATVALIPFGQNASRSAILNLVKASAATQDSAFTYDPKEKQYVYYTLLRLPPEIQTLLNTLPPPAQPAQTVFLANGWQPTDLTSNATSGLFALDSRGGVSRLVANAQDPPQITKLFQVSPSGSGNALTATADSVLVAASSSIGCTLYRYSLATKAIATHLAAVHERCLGIATDGTAIYVSFAERKEIRYWDNWDAPSYHTWSLGDTDELGSMTFDSAQNRLIVVDSSGRAYAISNGKKQLLSSGLGGVQSVAASRFHVLFASGKEVLFRSRAENQGENPPAGWPALPGGHLVGVAVDSSDNLWVADFDNKLVKGPYTLI